jgi:hypothetical protein
MTDLGIINAFKCCYAKLLIQKTVAMIDRGLLQDATQMKLDVLSAMHFAAEDWELVTLTTIKNCFVKCHFSNDPVSGSNENAMKLSEDEDDWHKYYVFGHYPSSCLYLKTAVYFSNHNVSETGFRLHLQVKPTQLGPIDRASPYLWTPVPASRWST